MGSKRVTDYDILKKHYTFLNDENDQSWESNLVSSYHESLFKEYAVCDLSRYKSGDIALRWRTSKEVVDGKCESICANISCEEKFDLCSYEVLFNYMEHKLKKQARINPEVVEILKMSNISLSLEDSISLVHKKSLESDLTLVEEKIKNELRCVYDIEIFDIIENVENTKNKVSKLYLSMKELYDYKIQLFDVIRSQMKALDSLSELEGLKDLILNKDTLELIDLAKNTIGSSKVNFELPSEERPEMLFKGKLMPEEKVQKDKDSIEFVPVTETQFESVPILVKRRAKLAQVNELLKFLHNHALKRNKCVPIKVSDINSQGIKVYGQTGSSKIAILRYLKIIEVINRDNTVLLLDQRFKQNKVRRSLQT